MVPLHRGTNWRTRMDVEGMDGYLSVQVVVLSLFKV